MLIDMNLTGFMEEVASNSPAPGGGSVSALAASLSAALIQMVAELTLGQKGGCPRPQEVQNIHARAGKLKQAMTRAIDEDTEAFKQVMTAYRLPGQTEEEKRVRKETIQAAYRQATRVPMGVSEASLELLALARDLAGVANPNAWSDLAVAVYQAQAGVNGALQNVRINLAMITDEKEREVFEEKHNHAAFQERQLSREAEQAVEMLGAS